MNLFDVGSVSLIAIIVGDTTAHEVRQRARCNNCGVNGKNTYHCVTLENAMHEGKSQRYYTNITMRAW